MARKLKVGPGILVQRVVGVGLASANDKIFTVNVSEFGISNLPQGSELNVTFTDHTTGFQTTIPMLSNRESGRTVAASQKLFPRFIESPKLGNKSSAYVTFVKRNK